MSVRTKIINRKIIVLTPLILNAGTNSEYRVHPYPAVDPPAIIADLEPRTLNGLDKVQLFVSIHFAQNNVAFLEHVVIVYGFYRAQLA